MMIIEEMQHTQINTTVKKQNLDSFLKPTE